MTDRTKGEAYLLRLPAGLGDKIADAAKANRRSMNSEIVARIQGEAKTLRDEFAMAALNGMLVAGHVVGSKDAYAAYAYADAMLAARKGGAS